MIYFGPDNDTLKKIKNIHVFLHNDEVIDGMTGLHDIDCDALRILKSCNELWICFEVGNKMIGELYIPIHNIKEIRVDHFEK